MPEVFHNKNLIEEMENDGWQNLDWHDWKLATRDKTLGQYLEKQAKEAIAWYCQTTGKEIPGYDKEKGVLKQDRVDIETMNKVYNDYLTHIDEKSGLPGSEDFARRHKMYLKDLPEKEIEKKYLEWLEKEHAQEEKMALEHLR